MVNTYYFHTHHTYIHTYFKEVLIIGNQHFNSLPTEINDLSDNPKIFKIALKHFLYSHSFYTLDECLNR